MACKYYYKGHEFSSERQLDDFLLERRKYESALGDIVFSEVKPKKLLALQTMSNALQESNRLNVLYKKYNETKGKVKYDEDGNSEIDAPPYKGVNAFLSGLKGSDGKLLFPEFRAAKYWEERFKAWKDGDFNEKEIELFGLDKQQVEQRKIKITDSHQQETYRKMMEDKWEAQAKTGTAVHNVLLVCFSKVSKDGKTIIDLSDDEILRLVDQKVSQKNKEFLNPQAINDAIAYAKQLKAELLNKLGDSSLPDGGLSFFTEFAVSAEATEIDSDTNQSKDVTLMGIVDLVVIDNNGIAHIIDYKTSIHDYAHFNKVKKEAYSYQMATYQRMLLKWGIDVKGGRLFVAPIQIMDFAKNGDKFEYSGLQYGELLSEINTSIGKERMWNNIDMFLPEPFTLSIETDKACQSVSETMSKWFPDNNMDQKATLEKTKRYLLQTGQLKKNDNGQFVFNRSATKEEPITETDEVKFIEKVHKHFQDQPKYRIKQTQDVKNRLKDAIKNGISSVNFPSPRRVDNKSTATWLKDQLEPYCNGMWEVIDNETLEDFGIIMVRTKEGEGIKQRYDFIRVSTNTLTDDYNKLQNDKRYLTGNFVSDLSEKSKSNSLMLQAVYGNVELMETMLLINQIDGINAPVGKISVVNPSQANGMSVTNEELFYCFSQLDRLSPIGHNKFKYGEIKLASKYELISQQLNNIVNAAEEHKFKDEYVAFKGVKSSKSILDLPIDASAEDKIRALRGLLKVLEENENYGNIVSQTYDTRGNKHQLYIDLYNDTLAAIAQLKGVNFRQQLKDHDRFMQSFKFWEKGISGSYTDNPGNLDSETLNLVTKLVTEAYQNTRDDLQRDVPTVRRLVENLKKDKGMTAISENTFGNQVSLYENMFQPYTEGGDFLFKDWTDSSLSRAESEFLKYALEKINQNRYPNENLDEMRMIQDPRYYRVPLTKGDSDTVQQITGLKEILKDKLSYLMPKKALDTIKKKLEGTFSEEEPEDAKSRNLFKMTNMFDRGEIDDKRFADLSDKGITYFEHNIESILCRHMFAYSVQRNIDGVFPMIKAAMIHINEQGIARNIVFKNDKQYLTEYIQNKLLNQTIVNPEHRQVSKFLNFFKNAASAFTLAFSPVQALYQPLQGLWVDVSLLIRKPDGKESFTLPHFRNALKIAYSDLSHFSDSPTLCSLLNETYGLNDMDMNNYANLISSSKKGIWNFHNFMFKFASRPDYYNRLTIFLCQLQGDGCLDAHSVVNGKLVYDWTKDSRFSEFAKNPKGNSDIINKQRSLYYQVAKQFVIEHAKDADGNDFVLDMNAPRPLPRAYTNKESEAHKSLADDIYGYYSHEKKSLIMSTVVGSMWLQFKTYWSGKKNQYLQPGGVRLRGEWVHYEENGKKYYYQVDENNNIKYELPMLAEDDPELKSKIAPAMQWKGLWQEGIILTLSKFIKNSWNDMSFRSGYKSLFGDDVDPRLQHVYQSNLRQLGYDIFMFAVLGSILGALLGDWLDGLKKENKKNPTFVNGLKASAANIAVMSVKNSFLDFNFYDSVIEPSSSWTPFAFEWISRTGKNWVNVATSDDNFLDGIVKTSSGLRTIKPLVDVINVNYIKDKE